MLVLPIKKKWFQMILIGEKKEEYREIKPYYQKRFKTIGLLDKDGKETKNKIEILFRNGYGTTCPSFIALCSIKIKTGNTKWGAEDSVLYYALQIHEVLEKQNIS